MVELPKTGRHVLIACSSFQVHHGKEVAFHEADLTRLHDTTSTTGCFRNGSLKSVMTMGKAALEVVSRTRRVLQDLGQTVPLVSVGERKRRVRISVKCA